MFITSFLIGISFINNVNANSTGNLEYEFEKDYLYDDFDTLDKTNVNLRNNNINTLDYNGTYSFTDDGTYSAINWSFSQDGGSVIVNSLIKKHRKVLDLNDINSSEVNAFTTFDNQLGNPTIEFWILTNDSSKYSWSSIRDDESHIVFIAFIDGYIKYNDGSWHTILANIENNYWYHIKITIDTSNNLFDLWLDDIKRVNNGNTWNNIVNGLDSIFLSTTDEPMNYRVFYDAFGFSWKSDYYIGLNKYPIIEIVDSNILSRDKYDFNLDSNNNPYPITGYPEIYGWNKIYNTESHIYLDMDNSENGVEILGELDGCGIKNDSLGLYGSKFNITFDLRFMYLTELDSYINFTINGFNNTKIIELKFDTLTNSISNLSYFNGINYIDLVIISNINQNNIYSFNLYIYNFNVRLFWYKNNIYNNTYNFPLINNIKDIDTIKLLLYDNEVDENYLVIRLNSIGIYQYNISLTKENGYLDCDLNTTWKFTEYNLFKFTSNELIKIVVYGILDYPTVYYLIREFDNKDCFLNLYEPDKFINQAHLWFITKTSFNPINILFSIEGIKICKYIDNIFDRETIPKYYYHNIIGNQSYYYIDNSNRLHYQLDITQNDTHEYMMIYFDFIRHISSNNKSIYFKCRELSLSIGNSYITLSYWQPPDYKYYFKTYKTTVFTLLAPGKEFGRLYIVANDLNNNNYTNSRIEGYLYDLKFNYIPFGILPMIDIIPLNLIAIMIPLIILIVPTIAIYSVYRKREIIIPVLLLMSILCFVSNLIPFEMFFIMILCFGAMIFIQYKKGFNQE